MVLKILNRNLEIDPVRLKFFWLFAAISTSIIPHLPRLPVWAPVLVFTLTIGKLFSRSPLRRPRFRDQILRIAIAVIIVTGILASYGTLVGRDAGISLLILLSGMKFLETRNQRDYYITCYISIFTILTNFLYSQSILSAVYMLFVVIIIICALIAYNDDDGFLNTSERFYISGSLVLQSIPLMLVLFVLFPRIPGPLWGLPRDAGTGLSGIDDVMEPGSLSELILSNEIAFRVEFENNIPEQSKLYWRGPVLWITDGVKWFQDRPRPVATRISFRGDPVKYTVTLEPTEQNWLYALEIPIDVPEESAFSHDLQIKASKPVSQRRRYTLTSYTDYVINTGDDTELNNALQLPIGYHTETIALGKSWKEQGISNAEIVNKALRMFNEQEFFYTTSPPRYLRDTIDQFLFDSKQGFCEHYAAAFTILMRAAGIPARVITGYQGGKINPIDGFLVVRQRDAHAWTEVWLQERGWVRIDPTSAVSPLRIMEGIENAMPESIIDIPGVFKDFENARNFWRRYRDTIDAINNRWNQWVLSYDTQRQSILFSRIGMGNFDMRTIGITLILVLLIIFSLVYLWLFRQRKPDTDAARHLFDIYCLKMARLGLQRRASEGPLDFASRSLIRRKDLAQPVNKITELYINVRYGNRNEQLELLKRQVKDFKPA